MEIMDFFLAHNNELQISDRVLKAVLTCGYSKRAAIKKMEFLLSRPGIVISESFLSAASEAFASEEIVKLLLTCYVGVDITTIARRYDAPELFNIILNKAADARALGKGKEVKAPVERRQKNSFFPKKRKLCITEKVLVAAASGGPQSFEFLLRHDLEIRITGAVADAVMKNTWGGRAIRFSLLSKFRENLTQEAFEKFEDYSRLRSLDRISRPF